MTACQFVNRAVALEADLTHFGFGIPGDLPPGAPAWLTRFADQRAMLFEPDGLRQVVRAASWLLARRADWCETPARGSYSLKHRIEAETGRYVSNGALLAAAIGLGVPYARNGPGARLALRRRARKEKTP